MKFVFPVLFILIFTNKSHSQTLTYSDTISTPIGDFMLETNEAPASSVSFDHQTLTAQDGGSVEQVNFFPSTERRAAVISAENVSFSIKPNPVKDIVSLQVKKGGADLTVSISDISGRVISTQHYYSANGEYLNAIDLTQYSSGIYFVELNTGGYQFSQKLVKE